MGLQSPWRSVHTEQLRHVNVSFNVMLTGGTFDLSDGNCEGQNGLHTHFAYQCSVFTLTWLKVILWKYTQRKIFELNMTPTSHEGPVKKDWSGRRPWGHPLLSPPTPGKVRYGAPPHPDQLITLLVLDKSGREPFSDSPVLCSPGMWRKMKVKSYLILIITINNWAALFLR